jgi:hypothetical protein
MTTYWKYLLYVLRHKWFVFVECAKFGYFLPGLTHDMSKLRISEFIPYARHFYGRGRDIHHGRDKTGYYKAGDTDDKDFNVAWLLHQHRNPHHWQYWLLTQDEDEPIMFEMPTRYLYEMVADWRGAGMAQGTPDTLKWYMAHRAKMLLHPATRNRIETILCVPIREQFSYGALYAEAAS